MIGLSHDSGLIGLDSGVARSWLSERLNYLNASRSFTAQNGFTRRSLSSGHRNGKLQLRTQVILLVMGKRDNQVP